MEIEDSSDMAYYVSLFTKLFILFAITSNIVSSLESMQFYPDTCEFPACNNNPFFCPNIQLCAPQALPVFYTIEAACAYIFTIELSVRYITCWAVSPR